jgi:hypothetical protein
LNTPLGIIVGAAGSGKDTVAALLSKYIPTMVIAQADPLKRFTAKVFGFTEHQLWGPSNTRNAPDPRFDKADAWTEANKRLVAEADSWLEEVLLAKRGPNNASMFDEARDNLFSWFNSVATAHEWNPRGASFYRPSTRRFHGTGTNYRQLTPRYVLQTLGTEWGRNFSKDMWNKVAIKNAMTVLGGGNYYSRMKGVFTPAPDSSYELKEPALALITDGRFRNEVLGVMKVGGFAINVVSPGDDNSAIDTAGIKGHVSETELKGIPSQWFKYRIVNDKSKGLLALENVVQKLAICIKEVSPPSALRTF